MSSPEFSLQIEGMHCGSCVSRVDKALRSVPGVADAAVNLTTNTARVTGTADPNQLLAAIEHVGYKGRLLADLSAQTVRGIAIHGQKQEQAEYRRLLLGLLIGVPAAAAEMILHHQHFMMEHFGAGFHNGYNELTAILTTIVMIVTGGPFFIRGLRSAIRMAPNMDTLIALGAGTAYLASLISFFCWLPGEESRFTGDFSQPAIGEFHAAITIIVLVTLGKYLETRAKKRATSAVAGLSAQASATATRLRFDGSLETIPAEQIQIGDHLQILAHQQLPVDGQVIEGAGSLDLSIITGESIPVEIAAPPIETPKPKSIRSLTVLNPPIENILPGGATLADGRIILRATSTAHDSTVANILDHVNAAQASKTQIQTLADRVASIFVPIILLLAALNFAAWILITHNWQHALLTTIATIVIACPCAMGLATPTAITVAIGRAAKLGILFTNAAALESARIITTVLFDKTGTLTTGKLEATEITGPSNMLQLAASIEQYSEHPLAKAILAKAAADSLPPLPAENFHSTPGGGVTATVNHRPYAAGSASYIGSLGVPLDPSTLTPNTQSTIFLADLETKSLLGTITLRDTLRPDASATLQTLHNRGYQIGILTGDSEPATQAALKNLPIDFLRANVRPEQKAAAIKDLKSKIENQKSKISVAFIGDGINDAPALAAADLGIAMSSATDIAKAAGDVLLMSNHLAAIPQLLQLSRHTLRIIRQNLFWAFGYNVAAIPLAMLGILPPGLAAAAMMLSSLTVVANALRLYRVRL